ncbi:permease (plasmid) [Bacillus thuringiensis]|uniref:Permease n=1 Tax=Bacillus thuringiensis TaxID=1428 RepID=A0A9W3SJ65_BACTU|nr:VanZ family protein [Bacillus thuringiensis]ANS52179.1 permease [Bacillus thuringiensis]
METYLLSIKTAFIIFLIVVSIVSIPFLLWQYKKYGYIHYFHTFIVYSLLLYGISVYCLVIFPLPATFNTCSIQKLGMQHYSLVPFTFVTDFLRETNVIWNSPMTYTRMFKERGFIQVVCNMMLLFPLGIYLRYYFCYKILQTLLIISSVSLFFEITQLTGIYGLYNCPYRLFDIDDIILNTSGGIMGFYVFSIISWFSYNKKTTYNNKELSIQKL